MLQEGYETIVGSLNKKTADSAQYISEMVKEYFDAEYPISAKESPVSERDDNFIRLTLYRDTSSLIHLLPRAKANAKIFDKLMGKQRMILIKIRRALCITIAIRCRKACGRCALSLPPTSLE